MIVSSSEPASAVGDLDDDDAGVGVVAGAAAGRLEVRCVGEGQDAAVGDAEQVVVDAGGVVAGGHDGVGEGRRPVRVGGRVGADGLLVLGRVGRGRVAVGEDGRGLVGVGDRHGDRLGRRVGGVGTVGRGDGDHVVLAAAVGGGRLVVGDAVGLEPELGVAVDLEEVGVGATGDREGHGVAGVGVAGGEDDHVLDVLGYRGGGARREGRVLVVDVLDGHGHGDRVVVGAGEPVGDLDDDDAGVGVVAGAAAGRLEVRGAVERQDAAVGDAEQVVVDAGGVVAGGHDGVGEGRGPVRVGGRVGAGRR